MIDQLTTQHFVLLTIVSLMIGVAKAGIPGAGTLIVPLMATIFAANVKSSVGILLPMLIVGDTFAVIYYKRHADWAMIRRLFPWVIPGLIGGAVFLYTLGKQNDIMKPLLGAIVLIMLIVDACRRHFKWEQMPHSTSFRGTTGVLAFPPRWAMLPGRS